MFAPDASGEWRLANSVEWRVLEGLGGSRTGVCSAIDEADAVGWLCWVLAARLQPNLTGALGVGAGWECWEALTQDLWAGDWWGPDFADRLGDRFWERVRSHRSQTVRDAAAAGDPDAGRRALRQLGSPSSPPEVLDIAASHPRIPGWALLRLLRVERYQHAWRAAQKKSAPRWVLGCIVRGRSHAGFGWAHSRACLMVAQNPAAARRTLRRIAGSDDWGVRTWAAYHSGARRRTLRRLAGDDHWWVRRCVAQNPKTPRWLVEPLAFDRRREVRADAVANPKLPDRLVEHLAGDRSEMVRASAARRPGLAYTLVEELAADRSLIVRAAVAARPGVPDGLFDRLAGDSCARVRKAAALNPDCPPRVLERLAADRGRQVRAFAVWHPACPPEALFRLVSHSPQVRLHLAENRTCPPQALARLACDRNRFVRAAVAANPGPVGAEIALRAKQIAPNIGQVYADRGFTTKTSFKLPLFKAGIDIFMDQTSHVIGQPRTVTLGRKRDRQILIEHAGSFFPTWMPKRLLAPPKSYKGKRLAEWYAERSRYAWIVKQKLPGGGVQIKCPQCDGRIKSRAETPGPKTQHAKDPVDVIGNVDKTKYCCKGKLVSVSLKRRANVQPIPFGTPAWKMAYAVRNQIENANKGLKDKNAFRLGWCRALGLTANLLGSIMHMVAYNIDLARKARTRSP